MKNKVIEIPAVPKNVNSRQKPILRVAAYCRVSTDGREQGNSLENQIKQFKKYIKQHDGWILEKVYSDKGISGKATRNRPAFLEMIKDCQEGKIDLVITKSISRFARNTRDTIDYVRLLRDMQIGIYFDKENLFTLDAHIDIVLTIMSSLAEEESRSLSNNVKWTFTKQAAQGHITWPRKYYGYSQKGQTLTIIPSEAKVVRAIFDMYEKVGRVAPIAKWLTENNVTTPKDCGYWHPSVIYTMLSNEVYVGDIILQKTYAEDFLSKRRKNTGQAKKWYIPNHHERIITRAQFKRVQILLNSKTDPLKKHKSSTKYPFSSLIYCDVCGRHYMHDYMISGGIKKEFWVCTSKKHDKSLGCTSTERILNKQLIEAYLSISPDCTMDNLRKKVEKICVNGFNVRFFMNNGDCVSFEFQDIKKRRATKSDSPSLL